MQVFFRGSVEWGVVSRSGQYSVAVVSRSCQLSVWSLEMRVGSLADYSFMNLNLLLRNPTYSNLHDLYV